MYISSDSFRRGGAHGYMYIPTPRLRVLPRTFESSHGNSFKNTASCPCVTLSPLWQTWGTFDPWICTLHCKYILYRSLTHCTCIETIATNYMYIVHPKQKKKKVYLIPTSCIAHTKVQGHSETSQYIRGWCKNPKLVTYTHTTTSNPFFNQFNSQ